jgi:hypothetical protein
MPKADGTERNFHEPVPDSTVVAMVCADCEIMSASFPQDAVLRCICPGYQGTKVKGESHGLVVKTDGS